MLLLLGAVLSSCGSDDDGMDIVKPVTPPASGTSWTVDVVAETTRGLTLDGDVPTQSWSTNDNIFVYYKNQKVGVLHPASAATSGVVKLLGNIDTPATPYSTSEKLYFYYGRDKGFSDYSGQDGTLVKIASDYDYATAEAEITAVNTSERKLTVALASFQPQQAIVKFTFKRGDVGTTTKPNQDVNEITISTVATGNIGDGITFTLSPARNELYIAYIALPVSSSATAEEYFINAKVGTNPDFVGKLPKPSEALQKGKYYTSEVRLYEAVQLWANGPMWAKNNLWTAGTTESNPTDPSHTVSNGYYDSKGGSYFCWAGKDGRDHANLFDWAHYPYGSSQTSDNKYSAGMTLDFADDAAYVNWGKACRIPTNDEFSALIDNNNTTHQWSSSGTIGITFRGKAEGYTDKSIFLPAMGFLTSTASGTQSSDICYYWSSSCLVDNKNNLCGGGLKVEYTSGTVSASPGTWANRYQGMQIRPIIPWK